MSQHMHAFLTADGTLLDGVSSELECDGVDCSDSLECFYHEVSAAIPTSASTQIAQGRPQLGAYLLRRRVDKATPLIVKAYRNQETIEGTVKMFRPTKESGIEHYATDTIIGGKIASYTIVKPDSSNPAASDEPMWEEWTIYYNKLDCETHSRDTARGESNRMHQWTWSGKEG